MQEPIPCHYCDGHVMHQEGCPALESSCSGTMPDNDDREASPTFRQQPRMSWTFSFIGFGLGVWYNPGFNIWTVCIGPVTLHWMQHPRTENEDSTAA